MAYGFVVVECVASRLLRSLIIVLRVYKLLETCLDSVNLPTRYCGNQWLTVYRGSSQGLDR